MLVGDVMQRDVLTVTEEELLESVLRRMLRHGVKHAPVVREGRLVGIVSERNLLGHRARFGRDDRIGVIMTEHPYFTRADSSVAAASALMSTHKIGCLPVMRGDRLEGIVTTTDLLSVLAQQELDPGRLRSLRAADVMQREPPFAHAEDNLLDATLRMLRGSVRQLPVLDGERRVMGTVSEHGVHALLGDERALLESRTRRDALEHSCVAEIMTADACTAEFDTPLPALALRLFHEHTGAVWIVDDRQRLVGVVSYADVLGALLGRDVAA